jgi:hypothetical protein
MKLTFTARYFLVFFLLPLSGILLIPFFQYELTGDGISYISIAEKYLSGNFTDAINGTWSPLMSWTLMPLLFLNITPIIAFKIHSIIFMALICYTLGQIGELFKLKSLYINFLVICGFVVTLPYGLIISIPDLIVLFILLNYFLYVYSDKYLSKPGYAVLCGILGALAYLSKAYAFYFFIIHFILMHAIFIIINQDLRKKILLNFSAGMGAFILISAIWISLLTNKYNEFTISTAGKYNLHIISPGKTGHQVVEYAGLLAPQNETAVSAWEDPGALPIDKWNPLGSKEDFFYFLKNIRSNLYTTYGYYTELSPFSFTIILFLIFGLLNKSSLKEKLSSKSTWILLTILVYTSGYCLIFPERRYLLPSYLLILTAGTILLQEVMGRFEFSSWKKLFILAFIALSFFYFPFRYIVSELNRGKTEAMIAREIRENYNIRGNIASDTRWYESLFISYHMNCRYFGVPEKDISEKKLKEDIHRLGIDYYIDWLNDGKDFAISNKEITNGKSKLYKIYKFNNLLNPPEEPRKK